MKKSAKEPVVKLAESWQRCRIEDLPKAFYAYDETEQQSERVVTFRLQGKSKLKSLLKHIDDPQNFRFIVHLGLRPDGLKKGIIPNEPAFALFLQVSNGKDDWQKNCVELVWEQNSRFSTAEEGDPRSGDNAIPAAGAYLFVHSWLEMPEEMLAKPFTAATRVMGERVKAYIFSAAESNSIYIDLENSKDKILDIHLGDGLAVWVHPFSFRPVVEVKGAAKNGKLRQVPMNATGQTNDDGDSFYDYGVPIPPGDPD